jgi:hypothetical protein
MTVCQVSKRFYLLESIDSYPVPWSAKWQSLLAGMVFEAKAMQIGTHQIRSVAYHRVWESLSTLHLSFSRVRRTHPLRYGQ